MPNHVILSQDQSGHPVRTEPVDEHGWLGGWIYQETQVELMLAFITFYWACHLMRVPHSAAAEPVAKALYQVSHLQPPALTWIFLVFSISQAIAAYYLCTWLRRGILFFGFLMYCFILGAFWKFVPSYPGAFICIAYAQFSLVRLMQMCGRRP